ncbi:O-antigen translocase [Flavivirga amylovorans]|uniref:O-antigen translocase n=1 Tax=Flavivirga amylovorans TaxID=870486 RepID=A0ABT8X4R5_9FLAO|nr:O-antigen translocase [Flavivirga amylovorans]MDO5988963.1 O-antigen translocase [Flavivirga amylovorans]
MLLKVASFNSLSVFVKLVSGFVLSKAIAYFLFPQGMALTGNLRSFLVSCQGISVSGAQNGLIKYTAENKNNDIVLKEIISTSFFLMVAFTILISLVLIGFSDYFSVLVFGVKDYVYAIKILAYVIPLYAINTFVLAIINGLGKYKTIILINTIGYIVNVVVVVFLLYFYNLEGAIIAMITMPSVLIFITFFWIKEIKMIFTNISISSFSKKYLNGLSSFIVMAIFTALTIPIVHVVVKNYIITNVGLKYAGYWEAMIKISQYYLMFIMSLFSLYLLPKLSQNQTDEGFKRLIIQFYKTILPLVLLVFIAIYFFRYWVIRITLTQEFLPTQELFFWQLIGDFFKIASFAIAYQMQAKKMLLWYLFGELFYVSIVYFFSIYFIDKFEVKGAVIAHAISYLSYFLLMLFIFRKSLLTKINAKIEK